MEIKSLGKKIIRVLRPGRLAGLVCWLGWATSGLGQAGEENRQFRDDVAALGTQIRMVGTPGYEQAAGYIEKQIGALGTKVEYRRHDFEVMVPVTKEALVKVPAGGEFKVYPFWPAGIRVNATPAKGITGKLVYCGSGQIQEIRPQDVLGQIAVVEASAGMRWQQVAYFGARAILVLDDGKVTNTDLSAHEMLVPINLPRFYLPGGEIAQAIRKGEIRGEVTLTADVSWEKRQAHNYYVVIPARGNTGKPNPAAVLSVPFDAAGLVPDLAYSASQAVQTAAGLEMMREFATRPLRRPVMIFFGSADTLQMMGTKQMLMAFADVPQSWDEEKETLRKEIATARADLAKMQRLLTDATGVDVRRDRDALDRIVKIIETDMVLDQDRLFRIRTLPRNEVTEAMRETEKQIQQRTVLLNQVRYAFTRNLDELKKPQVQQEGKQFIQRTIVRLAGETGGKAGLLEQYAQRLGMLENRCELYRWLARLTGRNEDPDDRSNNSRVIEMMIALDLSDQGVRFGPVSWGKFRSLSNISQIQNYRDWFNRMRDLAEKGSADGQWFAQLRNVFDAEPLSGSQAQQSWLCAPLAIGTEMCQFWGVPGFSLVTLDDLRLRRDTPVDVLPALQLEPIEMQLAALKTLLTRAWDDPKFSGPVELRWQKSQFSGQVVSPAPGRPVPDLPREGFLATWNYTWGANKIPNVRVMPYAIGIRRTQVMPCSADGSWLLEGLPRSAGGTDSKYVNVQVYQVATGTGEITACTDLGRQTAGQANTYDVDADNDPMRSVVLNCRESRLVGLSDPRFLQDLGEVVPLDARRNAEPQRYNVMVQKQMMAGFFEPDMRAFLLFRYGRVGNRLLLLNTRTQEELAKSDPEILARGYQVEEINHLGALALVTARDFYNLDQIRIEKYRVAGVSSDLIDQMHKQAAGQLDEANKSLAGNDGPAVVRQANGAWANEARVYQATQDMANDVIRAAIFLLLLCVPFSFCMERLLVGTPNIYKQIAGTVAIFALMALAMWAFHPAFKISSSPLIIILSFAIIFMSIVVISVLYGKFDTELKRIRSGRGSAASTSFARASVLMSAVLLGIANMRRRKFRTALTAITIVLITFAVLCFTSASRYLDTVTLATGVSPTHSGIMLRQRGWRTMPENVITNLRAVLGEKRLVLRRWNVNAGDPKDQTHVVALGDRQAPRVYAAQAVLGLSPGEADLSPIAEVIGKGKYARLDNGERDIIYFSQTVADQLKVKEGDRVKVGGMNLQVAGIFDASEFDRRVNTLSGEPLAPLKYATGMLDAGGRSLTDGALDSLDLDADSTATEMQGNYEHLSATQFVIVPEDISRKLPNGALRSVALRLELDTDDLQMVSDAGLQEMAAKEELPVNLRADRATIIKTIAAKAAEGRLRDAAAVGDILVKEVSDELSKRFAIAIFAGFSEGVKMVAASNLASVSGAGQVAIPLAIAGMIIFNTMMGSIAERRREIHVYTSLGLAPVHVGALFLAEAMTYGLIGAVFGYVIGQGMGTLMQHLGWLGGVTLNYSGSSAMTTLGIILIVVLFSALVPARLASKIAAPSIDRSWRVPAPKDGRIIASLPFTINKTAADGCLAYLAEYFDAHQEGSIGKFSAGKVEVFMFADEANRTSRGLQTVIWLTPFDLGVRQHLMLLIHPGQFDEIYEVQVVLERLSGDDGSWYRMNRSFLTELRKQFLQWRSLTPQRMVEYVKQSQALFAQTPAEVVSTIPGESVRLG